MGRAIDMERDIDILKKEVKDRIEEYLDELKENEE